ncbi:MAG: ABC transporter ATP-binding protein [Microcella sp.]|uniref:ABC transporter ATP-binding protein n=1 Tax=Microcella sp. TaxID=1913979 RepID=UPI003315EEB6
MTPAIDISALTKRYGRTTALHGVDLAVEPGRVFGVIGPNGAGKTTTMRILLDIIRPTSGTVRVLGEDPRHAGPALRRRIGYLPGELAMDARLSARALLTHYAQLNGSRDTARIETLSERLGLDLSRPVRSLSKGNKQKVGLVQALSHSPDLLVLDEPTSGLDPLVQQEFLRLVREARNAGQTVFLSSHVISEIEQVADEVAVLRDGRIVDVSTVERLRAAALRDIRVTVPATSGAALARRLEQLDAAQDVAVTVDAGREIVSARLRDGIPALLAALAETEVLDLVVQEPDLERAVLQFYGAGSATAEEVPA